MLHCYCVTYEDYYALCLDEHLLEININNNRPSRFHPPKKRNESMDMEASVNQIMSLFVKRRSIQTSWFSDFVLNFFRIFYKLFKKAKRNIENAGFYFFSSKNKTF